MSYNDKKNLTYNTEKRRKIKEIKNNELNKECFDCGAGYPEYISINNGIFICKECLNIHNNFPKQISNTLKNNLSSLNSKELEFMYLGGNQKLLEFINYEYPQLQRYKISILYQTKAMQYYRNNLHYLVYGGIKPIKPNEKINAYELININEGGAKRENVNAFKKVDNHTYRETKRNKSETTLDTVNKKNNKEKKAYKSKKKKRKSSLLNTDDEDSLKRYKSFYNEMNKLFGVNIDISIDQQRNNKITDRQVIKEQKITSDNYRRKKEISNGNEITGYKSKLNNNNTNYNNSNKNTSNKEQPIEHIYNNNFFTLSATKNIFMFTPNKDSIIYKHRKIKNDKNQNKNNENIQSLNTVKEIYSKPKIPYLLTINKKRENSNNLFFSLQENNFKHHDLNLNNEKVNDININGDKYIKNSNVISKESKNKSDRKNGNKEINGDESKKSFINNQDIKYIHKNSNLINSKNDIGEDDKNAIFSKKRISKLMKRDRTLENENDNKLIYRDNNCLSDRKGNTLTIYRNEKNFKNLDKNVSNGNKIDKIIQSIKKDIKNDFDIEDSKNKTFTEFRENDNKRRKCTNSNLNTNPNNNSNINLKEKENKNSIRIEEGEEENVPPDKKRVNLKEKDSMNRGEKNENITKREEDKKLKCDSEKRTEKQNLEIKDENDKDNKNKDEKKFVNKRRKRFDKCIGIKEVENDVVKDNKLNNEKSNGEIIKKDEDIKKVGKDNCVIKKFEKIKSNQDNLSPFSRQNNEPPKTSSERRQLRREQIDNKINNSKDFHLHNSENPSCALENNFTDASKNANDNNENSGRKKFSIRNKYKMKKLKELV